MDKNHWYIPKSGWDYFVTVGLSMNIIVAIILIISYFSQ